MNPSKQLSCIIVDDEPLAREIMVRYVQRVPSLRLITECSNALEALEVLQQQSVDLVFLDIQMPELLGTKFAQILKNPPLIIITTAFQEYALQGYELDVVDYLLKPIQFDRFLKAVGKALRLNGNVLPTPATTRTHEEPYLYFRTDRKTVKVFVKDILYVEGMGNYVRAILTDGTIITKTSMTALEAMLPEDLFVRTHRSFIVARNKITSFSHDAIDIGKHNVPIGKLYRNVVLKSLESKTDQKS